MFYLISSLTIIAAIHAGYSSHSGWIIPASLAISLWITAYIFRQHSFWSKFAVVCGIALTILARTMVGMPPASFQPQHYNQHQIALTGRIVNNPQDQKDGVNVIIDQVVISETTMQWYGQVQLKAPLYAQLRYGDVIRATGTFHSSVPARSSYDQHLADHRIYGTVSWPSVTVIDHNHGQPMVAIIFQLDKAIQEATIRVFPKDEAGLLLGIVVGLQQPLSQNFSQALNNTSTTHIIVASGYNATIIIATALRLTRKLKRWQAISVAFTLLLGYVALSGFNPSMIRAAIMATIAITAQLLGRQKEALRLLYLTALVMLFINPLWIFDTSFQLSFAATCGVILLEPIIRSKIGLLPEMIKDIASTTIAAQALTIPIISITFGNISLLGMVANFLVLWLVPWVMLLGALTIPLIMAAPGLGKLLVWGIEPSLWYIKHSIVLAAQLPLAAVNLRINIFIIAIYYVLLIIIIWRAKRYADLS